MWASLQRGLHDMRQQLQDQLPELQQRLSQHMEQLGEHFDPLVRKMNALSTSSSREEEISLGEESRPVRVRILRKIGEGGYSFVYLAEVTASGRREGPWEVPGTQLALKKILAGGRDQLVEAQREIDIMGKLRHPNLLRLIDATIVSTTNAWDWMQQQRSASPNRSIPALEILIVFHQLCLALAELHSRGFAHRDVKPHNILLRSGGPPIGQLDHGSYQSRSAAASTSEVDQSGSVRATDLETIDRALQERGSVVPEANLIDMESTASSARTRPPDQRSSVAFDSAHLVAEVSTNKEESNAEMMDDGGDHEGRKHRRRSRHARTHAVLMDFGSAVELPMRIDSRQAALALQEDAERQCTAPYRAPELWEVPSSCQIGSEIDVWAAGCVLFTLMVGETPFERTVNESGGNLMISIMNGKYEWPKEDRILDGYPEEMRIMVEKCLSLNPHQRPSAEELVTRTASLIDRILAANDT